MQKSGCGAAVPFDTIDVANRDACVGRERKRVTACKVVKGVAHACACAMHLRHSQLLASTSPILCDLLKLAASQAPTGSKAVIPLDEFSELEATDVLKVRVPLMCAVQVNLARELGSGKANS